MVKFDLPNTLPKKNGWLAAVAVTLIAFGWLRVTVNDRPVVLQMPNSITALDEPSAEPPTLFAARYESASVWAAVVPLISAPAPAKAAESVARCISVRT